MFEGFSEHRIATRGAEIFALTGGEGPPLLLLHGYPQNHVMWHRVAPRLAGSFSLVIPDLRGYGDSAGPAPDAQHLNYSKRTMAADMIELMTALGHPRFSIAGHDRGGRVAYRLALDHPERVVRLAALDILPTFEVWQRMNKDAAMRSYHWLFLAQPAPLPEHLIGLDPDFYLRHLLNRWAGSAGCARSGGGRRVRAPFPQAVGDRGDVRRLPRRRERRSGARPRRSRERPAAVLPAARALGPAVPRGAGGLAARGLAAVGRRRARGGAGLRTLSRGRAARRVRGRVAGVFRRE